ncbi:regulatory protein GemA [Pacificibacter marinus]|uniref:regulatory protein GemA n=1 Tax=Pacificibacter marinus TaxID=658057 RepID=UPI001C07BFBD|nr:regulatory protein GemA [Pacificibacter marinus]MBU2867120.1 regulatory protein GemA [Pacificibacter marinus]
MANRKLQQTIHVGCRELGIDSDTRRDLQLVATGKASMSDMTDADLQKVVDALKERGFKTGFKGSKKGKFKPAPRADLRLVHVLWKLLGDAGVLDRPDRGGLNAFVRAQFGDKWQSVPIDIDALTDASQINAVIRALKSMCKRHGVQTQ